MSSDSDGKPSSIIDASDNGPSSGELIGAEFQKRRRRLFLYAVLGIVGIGAAIAGFVVYSMHKSTTQANDALSSLSMCVFGEAGAGDHPSNQFRLAQLGSMGLAAKDRGVVDGKGWPERCAPYAQDLLDRAKDAGLTATDQKDVGYWADQLAKRLKAPDAHLADAAEAIDQTFAEAKKAGLVTKPAPAIQGPPGIAAIHSVEDVASTSIVTKQAFPLKEIDLEKSPGDAQFGLVQDATVTPSAFLCDFADAGVVCSKLPESLTKAGHGLKLLGSTERGASPLVFEGNQGDGGVFRSDSGELVASLGAYGGAATKAGGAFVLGWDDAKALPYLMSHPRGAAKSTREDVKTDFDIGNGFFQPHVLWGSLFVPTLSPHVDLSDSNDDAAPTDAPPKDDKKDEKDKKDKKKKEVVQGLYVLPIDDTTGKAGEPTLVLPISTETTVGHQIGEPHFVACRTDKATAFFVWGLGSHDLVTFSIDGKWTKPLEGRFQGSLTCDGASVGITSIYRAETPWNSVIDETKCTSAACSSAQVEVKSLIPGGLELAPRKDLLDAVELNEKLIVAWVAGDRGGVRLRIAASREIENAKDIVVLDDMTDGGKPATESIVSDLRLIHAPGSPGHAVLLVSTKSGVLAFRIDPSGDVTPEKVTWK